MFNAQIGVDSETFLEENKKLVHYALKRYLAILRQNHIEYDDAYQVGCIGLIQAYKYFDPSKFKNGIKFSTYGVPMMEGYLRRFIRENNPAGVRYTRTVKDLARLVRVHELYELSREDLFAKLTSGDIPLPPSMPNFTQEIVNEVYFYVRNKEVSSLSEKVSHDSKNVATKEDLIGYEEDYTTLFVEDFLSTLSERERLIVEYRMMDVQQKKIGEMLGVGQVQISRLIVKIGEKLKKFQEERETPAQIQKQLKYLKEEKQMSKTIQLTPKEQVIHLLQNTDLTTYAISERTGMPVKEVREIAPEYRGEKRVITPFTERKGDRKHAAELLLTSKLTVDKISEMTGVPLGSLNKVKEYALLEKKFGLPITGQPLPKEIKKKIRDGKKATKSIPLIPKKEEKENPAASSIDTPENVEPIAKVESPVDQKKVDPPKQVVEPAAPKVDVSPVRLTMDSTDYEFEASNVPIEHLIIQLDAIKQMLLSQKDRNASYTIGINIT